MERGGRGLVMPPGQPTCPLPITAAVSLAHNPVPRQGAGSLPCQGLSPGCRAESQFLTNTFSPLMEFNGCTAGLNCI